MTQIPDPKAFPKISRPMAPFSLMVKPVGEACNLSCTYCYYRGKQSLLGRSRASCMSDSLLEQLIKSHMAQAEEIAFFC